MIKTCLRESFLTKELYQKLKQIRDEKRYRLATQVEHTFIDRSKHRKDLCIIIAGYKPYLYQDVFERLVLLCRRIWMFALRHLEFFLRNWNG